MDTLLNPQFQGFAYICLCGICLAIATVGAKS